MDDISLYIILYTSFTQPRLLLLMGHRVAVLRDRQYVEKCGARGQDVLRKSTVICSSFECQQDRSVISVPRLEGFTIPLLGS